MAQLTLDEMYQEIAIYTDTTDEVIKSNGIYTGDALAIVNRFKSAINYAKGKVVREQFTPTYSETVTLDANKSFDISLLTKTFLRLIKLEDVNENELNDNKILSTYQIKLPNQNVGDIITVYYGYMPSDLSALTDTLDLPQGVVDAKVLCYYAAYQYHLIEGGNKDFDKANYYLTLFNDGITNITANFGKVNSVVRVVYDGGE